jgi:hypothetical protein
MAAEFFPQVTSTTFDTRTMRELETTLTFTNEPHSTAFENFANAFLVPDYPELQALGGVIER